MTVLGAADFTVPIGGEIVRPRCGGGLTTALDAAEPPGRWSAEDARDVLHAMISTLDAHGVYRVTLEAGAVA